jgi:hypothetical protein
LLSSAPRFNKDFEHSMHKTFTDCYPQEGFTGGGWNYVLNSNDAEGESNVASFEEKGLKDDEQRLAYYCIGWDSVEVCFYTLLLRSLIIQLTTLKSFTIKQPKLRFSTRRLTS